MERDEYEIRKAGKRGTDTTDEYDISPGSQRQGPQEDEGGPLPSPLALLTGHVDSLKPPGGSETKSNPLSFREGKKYIYHLRLNCSVVKQ